MAAQGLVSLYHNSGAFGFAPGIGVHTIGWIGKPDPTIRPSAGIQVRQVSEPYAATLAGMLESVCVSKLTGATWLMPKSHWHYELHFGNRELLETVLGDLGIDPVLLADRNNGSAIEFAQDESSLIRGVGQSLLQGLRGSDFLLAFPGRAALCTIHHHEQLWWQLIDPVVLGGFD